MKKETIERLELIEKTIKEQGEKIDELRRIRQERIEKDPNYTWIGPIITDGPISDKPTKVYGNKVAFHVGRTTFSLFASGSKLYVIEDNG